MLNGFGLAAARTVRIAPAGLAATAWDGEGRAEWIVGESPCIALRPDHTLDAVSLALSSQENTPLRLGRIAAGVPIFIELPSLPVGRHHLVVRAQSTEESETCGSLDIVIRPAQVFEGAERAD
jgi:hypothetical protein